MKGLPIYSIHIDLTNNLMVEVPLRHWRRSNRVKEIVRAVVEKQNNIATTSPNTFSNESIN